MKHFFDKVLALLILALLCAPILIISVTIYITSKGGVFYYSNRVGKDNILFCGYHGWQDWYLSANLKAKKILDFHLLPGLKPLGVPKGLSGTIIPFRFNSWEDFEKIIKKNINNSAAIVIEPCREGFPDKKYLLALKKIAKKK